MAKGRLVVPDLEKKPWSQTSIFVAYLFVGCLAAFAFRAIFPGEASPLPILERGWRLNRGLLGLIALFPALALAALALPLGLGDRLSAPLDASARGGPWRSFSPYFFRIRFAAPVIAAIAASGIYALLFFLALPLAQARERNMVEDGEIFSMARARAHEMAEAGDWAEVSQLVGIADGIWPDSPQMEGLRLPVIEFRDAALFRRDPRPAQARPRAAVSGLPGHGDPLDAMEAFALAEAAFDEGRMADAHWLASVTRMISAPGSVNAVAAAQLAARAWSEIEAMRPGPDQIRAAEMFDLKWEGYNALLYGDYIRAFHVLREHARLFPGDPDVATFLARSEAEIAQIAFFTDEMRAVVGRSVYGPIFSLPAGSGRAVMRLESLSYGPDFAFALGLEYMLFDSDSRLLLHFSAPYVKFSPLAINGPDARRQVLALMRALDREDEGLRWEPAAHFIAEGYSFALGAQLILDMRYETFLTMARMWQGTAAMDMPELFRAAGLSREAGHSQEVFHAEILRRIGSGLFLLPLSILTLTVAWRMRARRRARVFFVPALFALPAAFLWIARALRAGLDVVGVSLARALEIGPAIAALSSILALAFILSLLLLSWQRE
ncbi:MAG: hypothetical protein FWE09_07325 [Treponema sp.]|nr:hypothetical protein [Treponema sp.]